jgi:hypothetical protein
MWSGDISRMGQLADRLADLAGVPSRAAPRVAQGINRRMVEDFDEGHDPYGTAWKPLATATVDKGRTPPPLTDTSTMRDTLKVRPLPRVGVGIVIDHPAAPHQSGWSGRQGSGPARPIVPQRNELPAEWQAMIAKVVSEEFRK